MSRILEFGWSFADVHVLVNSSLHASHLQQSPQQKRTEQETILLITLMYNAFWRFRINNDLPHHWRQEDKSRARSHPRWQQQQCGLILPRALCPIAPPSMFFSAVLGLCWQLRNFQIWPQLGSRGNVILRAQGMLSQFCWHQLVKRTQLRDFICSAFRQIHSKEWLKKGEQEEMVAIRKNYAETKVVPIFIDSM